MRGPFVSPEVLSADRAGKPEVSIALGEQHGSQSVDSHGSSLPHGGEQVKQLSNIVVGS